MTPLEDHWWYIERPFPWLLVTGFAVGGVVLSAVGALVAIEIIDGVEKLCQ